MLAIGLWGGLWALMVSPNAESSCSFVGAECSISNTLFLFAMGVSGENDLRTELHQFWRNSGEVAMVDLDLDVDGGVAGRLD
jgi:hypothetical protein